MSFIVSILGKYLDLFIFRLEISIGDPVKGSLVANNPVKTTAEKTPIPADSPLFSQVRENKEKNLHR